MKKNKLIKIFLILVVIINIIMFQNINVYATGIDDAISGGKDFISSADTNVGVNQAELKSASDTIFNMLSSAGVIIAVIVGAILGIKFMISSVEEKAQIKQYLMVYIVGCVVIFGAFTIWKIVIEVVSSF